MSTDDAGSAAGAERPQDAEIREILLRLLRMVAAEVATQLQSPSSAEPRRLQQPHSNCPLPVPVDHSEAATLGKIKESSSPLSEHA